MGTIDLRSDTVTCPDEAMRRAIWEAQVGDAGYGDDPSINELQELAAEITGQEEALFTPSGIMGNLISLMTHTRRGEAVIVGNRAHLYRSEGGGLSAVAGLLPYPVDDSSGCPSAQAILEAIPAVDVHNAQVSLLCLENTHNDCGGTAVSPELFSAAVDAAHSRGLKVHLDGARIFNAAAAWNCDVRRYTSIVDSVQFCLSKGLGAPMGSMVCGSRDFIAAARFNRKRVGGDLRQAGFMAAAGIYALKHNRERLSQDHENASALAKMLADRGLAVEQNPQGTNMVYFSLNESQPSAAEMVRRCRHRGVLFNGVGPRRIRLVTHLQISREDLTEAVGVIGGEAQRP